MAEHKLRREIVSLSVSDTWKIAKDEWKLNDIYFADEAETCLCGHFPIIELCELKNTKNKKIVVVGNCCVKKFIGLPSNKIFQAVKRVRKDSKKGLNGEVIELAHSNRWINDWEYKFYIETFRKRKLSERQLFKRREINEKVLLKINKNK